MAFNVQCSPSFMFMFLCRMMAVPATVIYFTCYDQLRDFLKYNLGFQGSHIPLVAGGLARCMSTKSHRYPDCSMLCVSLTPRVCVLQWVLWRWSALWSWSGPRCSPASCPTASCGCVSARLWLRAGCCPCGRAGDPPCSETYPSLVRAVTHNAIYFNNTRDNLLYSYLLTSNMVVTILLHEKYFHQ